MSEYVEHVRQLESSLGPGEKALRQAVGGEFEAVGKLEYHLLRSLGLSDNDLVVDVGCGSGRLSSRLAPFAGIRYIGTDVVPRLLEAARALTRRDDWKFLLTDGGAIDCPDDSADFVVFFSVLTHIAHEESFRYLREAARCLRPGGRVVASFLEFRIPCHWDIFLQSVNEKSAPHLNQFIDREGIAAWAKHSGLTIESFFDGDKPHIPIPEEIRWNNGLRMNSLGNLGQSVVVLKKK